MGLDLHFGLYTDSKTNNIIIDTVNKLSKMDFCNSENLSLNSTQNLSKYYRLNWGGLRTEHKFSHGFLGFFIQPKATRQALKVTLRQAKKLQHQALLIVGNTTRRGQSIPVLELAFPQYISKGKGNTIKVKASFSYKPLFVNQYSIYQIRDLPHFASAIDYATMGVWHGSNSENFVLQHSVDDNNNPIITISDVSYRQDEEDECDDETPGQDNEIQDPNETTDTTTEVETNTGLEGVVETISDIISGEDGKDGEEEPIAEEEDPEILTLIETLDAETISKLSGDVDRFIATLNQYFENGAHTSVGFEYIAANNLTLLITLKTFLDNKEVEFFSFCS